MPAPLPGRADWQLLVADYHLRRDCMELKAKSHSMDPVRKALQEFETAVVTRERWSMLESKTIKQQEADRARERVMEEIMELVRTTIAEREGRAKK
ncbi:MAG: hypothetical protein OEY20_13525 [Gemmatimonadota bacterium]|nr:hypothetical protein [Gemmatimonadota bacterium]MDH4349539.1 hypothetical protein [Gemmatimonadota bacterium]MDH5198258.1 hypothetical protein [Gemmatimonadota bacterium]